MKKTIIGITVIGKDKEGIVAAFTNFVFKKSANIEMINQNVMEELFGMYLEISFTKGINIKQFDYDIQKLAKKQKMEVSTHHEITSQKKIAIFVTKESHCLEKILKSRSSLKGKISIIIGTEKTLSPLAKKAKIPFIVVDERSQNKAEQKFIQVCKKYDIDLIVLARYMRILTPNFIWRYPERIINIHPSLLPAFSGALAYAQAFERGTKIIGVTAHYVTENLDQGPIILQDSFKVDPTDSLDNARRHGQKLEAQTLFRAIKLHLENKLDVQWRKVHIKSK